MGLELQSPSCGRHETGWFRGQREPDPWVMELLSQQHPPTGSNGSCLPSDTPAVLSICQRHPGHLWSGVTEEVLFMSAFFPGQHTFDIPSVGSQKLFVFRRHFRSGACSGLGPRIGEHHCFLMPIVGGTRVAPWWICTDSKSIQTRGGR